MPNIEVQVERNVYTVSLLRLSEAGLGGFPLQWRMKVWWDGYTIISSDTYGYDEFSGENRDKVMDNFLEYIGGNLSKESKENWGIK